MKKKNLVILLIIPFLVSLLGIATIKTTFNLVDNDILSIAWEYDDVEFVSMSGTMGTKLTATGVTQSKYPVGEGNNLVWEVENRYEETDENGDPIAPHAEIILRGSDYYLRGLSVGEVKVTCSNEKGNVFRSFYAIVYETGAVTILPKISASGSNVDSTIYYGEYDLVNGEKQTATVDFSIKATGDFINSVKLSVLTPDTIKLTSNSTVQIIGSGPASLQAEVEGYSDIPLAKFDFEVVEDGVNVYTFDDLINCTNNSKNGEIVVLRKSFESFETAYNADGTLKANNIECYGNYTDNSGTTTDKIKTFSVTTKQTTYNYEFLDQWNKFAKNQKNYYEVSTEIYVGLNVKQDFYGNGYTVNLHNLCFPSTSQNTDSYSLAVLDEEDIYRGPLDFYTLGNPNSLTPLISAYGQDNVGMYVEGDGVTVNDVKLKNCDFGNLMENLEYVGTVMEVDGEGITVKNSVISNGKNVVRSFSNQNFTLDNCLLSHSRNFLFVTGSNEYEKADGETTKQFTLADGTKAETSLSSFLSANEAGDELLNSFIGEDYDKALMKSALQSVQNALNDYTKVQDEYHGSTTITDSIFYKSGISAICLESLFNGPYLYANSPSLIQYLFSLFGSGDFAEIFPTGFTAQNISGISYPVTVDIAGDTRFYDYKNVNNWDISGLVEENISVIFNSMELEEIFGNVREITIDDIFPIKSILKDVASRNNGIYSADDGVDYINVPIAYYGGGYNGSKVTIDDGLGCKAELINELPVDLLSNYLNLSSSGELSVSTMRTIMIKTVITVTGFDPFRFTLVDNSWDGAESGEKAPYLFGEEPSYKTLI